jgi:ATP-binding cassette subfamily E protein 1
VHRCPFGAIKIVTVPDELNHDLTHQYALNSFRLYSIPELSRGKVTALLGQNGMGKSTTLKILAGILVPNFGKYDEPASKKSVTDKYATSVMGDYFGGLYDGKMKAVLKDQNVDLIPKVVSGTIGEVLKRGDPQGRMDEIASMLNLDASLNKEVKSCSGGELQRFAIGATLLKDADIYLFDEMSSYLDVAERIRVAGIIQKLAKKKTVMVVEHDLALMDWMADTVHVVYGQTATYGIISEQRTSNKAINSFLEGYLREENVRIRNYSIDFHEKSDRRVSTGIEIASWTDMEKTLGDFKLKINGGLIRTGEVIGVLGKNALGKSSFAKMLAGVTEPDSGSLSKTLRISYKPQYISTDFDGTVFSLLAQALQERMQSGLIKNEIIQPLEIEALYDQNVQDLSGGELQRVSIALTLSMDSDLYILDEPSAHLDSAYRMSAARIIKRVMENNKKSAFVIDHDVYFIDLISDALIVFGGTPGKEGESHGPLSMREGMNLFLKDAGVSFRRDALTRRPRINKSDSRLDKTQRESGNYYYSE